VPCDLPTRRHKKVLPSKFHFRRASELGAPPKEGALVAELETFFIVHPGAVNSCPPGEKPGACQGVRLQRNTREFGPRQDLA